MSRLKSFASGCCDTFVSFDWKAHVVAEEIYNYYLDEERMQGECCMWGSHTFGCVFVTIIDRVFGVGTARRWLLVLFCVNTDVGDCSCWVANLNVNNVFCVVIWIHLCRRQLVSVLGPFFYLVIIVLYALVNCIYPTISFVMCYNYVCQMLLECHCT